MTNTGDNGWRELPNGGWTTEGAKAERKPTRLAQEKARAERAEARAQRAEMLLTWRIQCDQPAMPRYWNDCGDVEVMMRHWHPERMDGGVIEVVQFEAGKVAHVEVWGYQDLWDAMRSGEYNAPWRFALAALIGIVL